MTTERFERLLQQYLLQQMTDEELKEFLDAAVLPEFEPVIKAALDRDLQSAVVSGSSREGQAMQSFENFKQLMAGQESSTSGRYRRMYAGTAWLRYAAILILVAGTVTWMLVKKAPEPQGQQPLAQQTTPLDIAPGGNKAQLTLSDGTVILLDSAADGTLAQQGNVQVVKQHDGQLEYQRSTGNRESTIAYNTLSTPRGGQYKLTLPDGSKVWLNAASSITYPTAFVAKERVVTVTGEAYFEVATLRRSGQKMPFIVKSATQKVEVLGTHFNINAYEDEPGVKTTLLEGSVRVSAIGSNGHRGQTALLKPGEQVSLSQASQLSYPIPVKTDRVMAWKNGIFSFHRAGLQEVMRQLSRWYNVDVVYEKGIPAMEFGGEMGRDLTLAQVLKGFEDMEIHFKIEAGNRLIVMP